MYKTNYVLIMYKTVKIKVCIFICVYTRISTLIHHTTINSVNT